MSNRDIRRQMRRLRKRSGEAVLRKWFDLERLAIERGLVDTFECGCCMSDWRSAP